MQSRMQKHGMSICQAHITGAAFGHHSLWPFSLSSLPDEIMPSLVVSVSPYNIVSWSCSRPLMCAILQVTRLQVLVTHLPAQVTHLPARVTHLQVRVTHPQAPVTHLPAPVTHPQAPVTHLQAPVIHLQVPVTPQPVQHTHQPAPPIHQPAPPIHQPALHTRQLVLVSPLSACPDAEVSYLVLKKKAVLFLAGYDMSLLPATLEVQDWQCNELLACQLASGSVYVRSSSSIVHQ